VKIKEFLLKTQFSNPDHCGVEQSYYFSGELLMRALLYISIFIIILVFGFYFAGNMERFYTITENDLIGKYHFLHGEDKY